MCVCVLKTSMKSDLFNFSSIAYTLDVICKKPVPNLRIPRFTPMFYCKVFIVLTLIISPLSYFFRNFEPFLFWISVIHPQDISSLLQFSDRS